MGLRGRGSQAFYCPRWPEIAIRQTGCLESIRSLLTEINLPRPCFQQRQQIGVQVVLGMMAAGIRT